MPRVRLPAHDSRAAAIARGEVLFNSRSIVITGVAGITMMPPQEGLRLVGFRN